MPRWLRALLNLPPADSKVPLYGPQGVTLIYRDGMKFENVPSVYVGTDPDNGCATYELLPPRDPAQDKPIALDIEVIPPLTSILFPFDGPPKVRYQDDKGNTFDGQITPA